LSDDRNGFGDGGSDRDDQVNSTPSLDRGGTPSTSVLVSFPNAAQSIPNILALAPAPLPNRKTFTAIDRSSPQSFFLVCKIIYISRDRNALDKLSSNSQELPLHELTAKTTWPSQLQIRGFGQDITKTYAPTIYKHSRSG
jgi:hypothetical protein